MRTFDERMADVSARMKTIKSRRRRMAGVAASCVCLVLLAAALVLFVPFDQSPPDIRMYADSDYYELIQKINSATYTPPKYANNFEVLRARLQMMSAQDGVDFAPGDMEYDASGATNAQYAEVTDNQVAGVIEADIFKRSNEYLYCIYRNTLYVYDLAGEASAPVGTFTVDFGEGEHASALVGLEIFLSDDCTTVTVVGDRWSKAAGGYMTYVIDLDVSDPTNITQTGRVAMRGQYMSARLVDGKILLMSNFTVSNVDFSDESTYLPCIETEEGTHYVAAADIYSPDVLTDCAYTGVCLVDSETLEILDSTAFLSYSDEVYVSAENIYVTRAYAETKDDLSTRYTQILCVGYAEGELTYRGEVTVAGTVKDQYSMDEYEGILRLVTTLRQVKTVYYDDVDYARTEIWTNASLYCVSLDDFSVISQVNAFAPDNETAESVRFDGEKCYVCTARIASMKDPVYFFDLSDPLNITSTDTGTIDGYSTSLIRLNDGFLLGVGYSDDWALKLEIYAREGESVVSVCAYEEFADFPEEYKAYLIDRENDLFGIPISSYYAGREYLLVYFDGNEIRELVRLPIETAYIDMVRACIDDGLLYVLFYNGDEAELTVTPIGGDR